MDGCASWHDHLGMWSGSVAIRFRVDAPQAHFMRDACLKAHACQIARVPNSRNQNPNLVPGTAPRAARCGMPIVPCFRLLPSPLFTRRFQQSRTQRYVAVFPALALPNVDDHAFAVDVLDSQTVRRRPHSGGTDLMDKAYKAYPMERTGQRPVFETPPLGKALLGFLPPPQYLRIALAYSSSCPRRFGAFDITLAVEW